MLDNCSLCHTWWECTWWNKTRRQRSWMLERSRPSIATSTNGFCDRSWVQYSCTFCERQTPMKWQWSGRRCTITRTCRRPRRNPSVGKWIHLPETHWILDISNMSKSWDNSWLNIRMPRNTSGFRFFQIGQSWGNNWLKIKISWST